MITPSTEKGPSDSEIIQKVLHGEINLYEIIVRRYNGYLYKTGKTYGYNHEDVQDLMQETYVNAYKNLKKFEGKSSLKTWLIRIMLNQCYHKKQKLSFQREKPTTDEWERTMQNYPKKQISDGNRTIQNLELKEIIEASVLRIPQDYRIVFSLREITGLSTAETANMLQLTETNVKVRLNRARKMLREEIEKSYSPAELFDFNLIYCDSMVNRVMDIIKNIHL